MHDFPCKNNSFIINYKLQRSFFFDKLTNLLKKKKFFKSWVSLACRIFIYILNSQIVYVRLIVRYKTIAISWINILLKLKKISLKIKSM